MATGKLARMMSGLVCRRPDDYKQSPIPASDWYPYLLCVRAAWCPSDCGPCYWNYGRILRRDLVSRSSDERLQKSRIWKCRAGDIARYFIWIFASWLYRARVVGGCGHHGTDRDSRNDMGYSLSAGEAQPSSVYSGPFRKRRNGALVDRLLYVQGHYRLTNSCHSVCTPFVW